jgi:phosphoglycerate kinase
MAFKSVKDADVSGKRVLIRVDFNVPLDMAGATPRVVDDMRIKAAIPTIEYVLERGASKVILLTHVGRPEGKVVEELKVAPILEDLKHLITNPNIELEENLRFDPREEANDEAFAKELANLGDVYVNEAFPASHREDASIVGIPKFLPSYAGLRFIEEVERVSVALTPPRNALAIVGGAKLETKRPLLEKLVALYKELLLAGALANDILKARGLPVGSSMISDSLVPTLLAQNTNIIQPVDVVLVAADGTSRTTNTADVRQGERIVDIGPKTAQEWANSIAASEFVLWNGPTGIYEQGYTSGTDTLAAALSNATCKALIGGGDTEAALAKFNFDPARIFISTGGGAMLQLLADGTLPGIEALKSSKE